jgi:MOSC domain-containing protein YiiM
MKLNVSGVFTGRIVAMPGDGRPTAIFKQPVAGRVRIGREGLEGDEQADRRVHGGPEKAVHHFPLETHARLAREFPEIAAGFVAGGLGENISTLGATEENVRIGDVFALGTARVQVCQPRTPCWKIEARHSNHDGLTMHVADHGIAGWYYRVLAIGEVAVGDTFELLERDETALTLRGFWTLVKQHRPDQAELARFAALPTLAAGWKNKLADRLAWLRANPGV